MQDLMPPPYHMQPVSHAPDRWALPRPSPLARALAAASLLTLALPSAWVRAQTPTTGLPVGPTVASGQAQISVSASGSTMTIVNTPQTILNWNSFSIGAGKSVVFQQANANSAVLNRVTGQEASSIFGSLSSNGRVWLLNPNGVLFGPSARVDVGGLVASTLRLSDSDWLAGRYSFESGAAGASIVNQGSLRSSFGGRIALLSSNVANEGVIDASGGQIVLAAGSTVELVDTGAPYVGVRVSAPSGEARNLGSLRAAGGRIDIHAAAVNSSGIISADGFVSGPGGEVWIKAVGPIGLAAGSRTTANAGTLAGDGGKVHIESSSGRSSVQGGVSAQAPQGLGGAVAVLGREVGLLDQAAVDVSGALGGGMVVAGGGLQGRDPTYANAQALFFGPQARISADATQQGAGGQIVIWSDQATRAYGSLSARGGPLGGDGGFIETSGGWLDARPARLDTAAPLGRSGSWLLDPRDITISDAVTTTNVSPDFTANGDDAFISTSQLAAALNAGTNVTVSTGGTGNGSQSGDITVSAANLLVTAASPGNLRLLADGGITVSDSSLESSSGPMAVQLLAGRAGFGSIRMVSSSITTPGNIFLGGALPDGTAADPGFGGASSILLDRSSLNGPAVTLSASGNGIRLANSSVSAADLLVQGSAGEGAGVSVSGASTLFASNNLTLIGDTSFGPGILITDGAAISLDPAGSAGSHLLRLVGLSTGSAEDIVVSPDAPDGAVITTRGGARLSIEGTNRVAIAGQAINALDGGPVQVTADRLDITGDITASQLNFSGEQVRFGTGANVNATGTIRVEASELTIEAGAALRAESPGGSILLTGLNDTPLSSFVNDAGAAGLLVSGSARYIVYADSPAALSSINAGLTPNFKRVGAAFDAWSADAGNGLVFREARNANAVLSIASRSYDGTRNAPIDSAVVTASDFGTLRADARASYANPNAGVDKPATLDSPNAFTFTDADNIPILGYTVTTVGVGTVVPAGLSGTASVLNRVYDAGTSARIPVANLTGLVPGEQIEVSGSGQFNDKNVGNDKPVGSVSYTLRDGPFGLASNYRYLPETRALTGSITPLAVSVAGVTATNKVYDGGITATLTGTASAATLAGDSASLVGVATASFADKNVGTTKAVTVNGYTLTGADADAGNYQLTQPQGLTANISPLAVSVAGVTAANKVYDGGATARLTGTASAATLAGDSVTLTGAATASFADKNVGTAKAVTVNGYTLAGADAGNYQLTQPQGLTANITPLAVSVAGLTATNKVYDGGTTARVAGTASAATLAGDSVTLTGAATASFADKNVGTAKAVTVNGYTLTGADAGNYQLTQPQGLTANISPLAVCVAGVTAANKVYDGGATARLTGTASAATLAGDSVTLTGAATASFADKNVGTAKAVTVNGYTLAGADAGNYQLTQPQGLTANITPLAVSVAGITATNKVYDASTTATLAGTANAATLSGDNVSLAGQATASFSDKNVGTAKAVTVNGYTLTGADAGNYRLTQPQGLTANISPLAVSVAVVTAANKVYDGGATARLAGTASAATLAGDSVSLQGQATASFTDKNVGTAKAVTVNGYTLTGADAGNYQLAQPQGLTASITPLAVSVAGLTATNKVYDGGTTATLSGTANAATLSGDNVSLAGQAAASFADKNVGTAKAVTVNGYTLTGADAGNYQLNQPQGLTANITPLAVSVAGLTATNKVYDGSTTARLAGTPTAATLVGDSVSLQGQATASFSDKNVGTAKAVTVNGYTLTGADAGNYQLTQPQGLNASITPATLQYVATSSVRGIGSSAQALQGTVVGFVGSDTLTNSSQGTLVFSALPTPRSPAGRYGVVGSGLSAQNYVFEQAPGNAQALTLIDLGQQTQASVVNASSPTTVNPGQSALLSAGAASPVPRIAGLSDQTSPLQPSNAAPVSDFRAVRLSSMSAGELAGLLAGRRSYMSNLLSEAVEILTRDPDAAALRECSTLDEARLGRCIVTEKFKTSLASNAPNTPQTPSGTVTAASAADGGAVQPGSGSASVQAPPAPAIATGGNITAGTEATAAPAAPVPPQTSTLPAPPIAGTPPDLIPRFEATKRAVRNAALPEIERKIALLVGVDKYQDPGIPTLSNAVNDARAVADILAKRLGYEVALLENPGRPVLVAALNQLALTLRPRDSVVIYYAGHGELVAATNLGYWLLSDSVASQPETWLSNTDISKLVAQMGASQVALVSDSCYSGSLTSEERIRAPSTPPDPKAMLQRRSVVVMSSGGNEPVADEGRDGHSPFAWNLMRQLEQLNSWQLGGSVFERVRFAVARVLPQRPQYTASRIAGHQPGGDYLFEQRALVSDR